MAGWNLKNGVITEYAVSEDRIWSLFNYVFSDACKKRNTYKYGLIKALLDSAFSGEIWIFRCVGATGTRKLEYLVI